MAVPISAMLPDANKILALELPNLATELLKYLAQDQASLNRHNFGFKETVKDYPKELQLPVMRAFMEAWAYLEKEVLIAQKPSMETTMEFYFITRKGVEVLGEK